MIFVGAVKVVLWAYRALTFTNRKENNMLCDGCGIEVNSFDAYTDGNIVLCGSVYGNECDKEYFEYLEYAY